MRGCCADRVVGAVQSSSLRLEAGVWNRTGSRTVTEMQEEGMGEAGVLAGLLSKKMSRVAGALMTRVVRSRRRGSRQGAEGQERGDDRIGVGSASQACVMCVPTGVTIAVRRGLPWQCAVVCSTPGVRMGNQTRRMGNRKSP